ncbi:MAG TPA: TIR domain-containing protein, partial [Chloroflexia bacterium]
PLVIQSVRPWMSASDIEAGARWGTELSQELRDTKFGIICITRSNQRAPWIMFEAGALAKTIEGTYVVPYLIDLNPADVEAGPLTQFQAKRATKDETWALVQTINAVTIEPLQENQLSTLFELLWPRLEQALTKLPNEHPTITRTRTTNDMLEEVLNLVRDLARRSPGDAPLELAVTPLRLSYYEDLIRNDTSLMKIFQSLEPRGRYFKFRDFVLSTFREFPSDLVRALYRQLWPDLYGRLESGEQSGAGETQLQNDELAEKQEA